ncbi:TPA: hypothetical protein TZ820_000202 [Streptococcus suis]|nr:hypothetical protein [Streptococcus suis]
MKFWDMMKKFLSVEEDDYIPQSQHELERELANARHTAKEYKKLALLKNQECVRLQAICDCQAELLADREV